MWGCTPSQKSIPANVFGGGGVQHPGTTTTGDRSIPDYKHCTIGVWVDRTEDMCFAVLSGNDEAYETRMTIWVPIGTWSLTNGLWGPQLPYLRIAFPETLAESAPRIVKRHLFARVAPTPEIGQIAPVSKGVPLEPRPKKLTILGHFGSTPRPDHMPSWTQARNSPKIGPKGRRGAGTRAKVHLVHLVPGMADPVPWPPRPHAQR